MTRAVILQPFYLPYPGVFEMARLADTWVVLDDVQFVPRNWQTRNQVKTQHGGKWITVPVRGGRNQLIKDVQIVHDGWTSKHQSTIRQAYARLPGLPLIEDHLLPVLEIKHQYLRDLNLALFVVLLEILDLSVDVVMSSDIGSELEGSDRILDLCRAVGADRYLSGPSARAYLREDDFESAGVALEFFAFDCPVYSQPHGPFVPNLSTIDIIACLGIEASETLRGSGRAALASAN